MSTTTTTAFPDSGTMESSYFTVAREKNNALQVTREAVDFSIVNPGETVLENDELI